jgi:sugar lactone lactonase YvrE
MSWFAALLLIISTTASSTTSAAQPAGAPSPMAPPVVTRFAPVDNTFVEDLALDSSGAMVVSKTVWGSPANTGRLLRVSPAGEKTPWGPRLDLGSTGMLLGVAVNSRDEVFVAWYDFGGRLPSAIYRIGAERAVRVATFRAGVWPNDLAFHHERLYVTDSSLGNIWRFRPSRSVQHLVRPWAHSHLFRPTTDEGIGLNGLAFWRNTLYAVNASRGTVVRVALGPRGGVSHVQRVTARKRLLSADGLVFTTKGRMWVVVNGTSTGAAPPHDQFLLQLTRHGEVTRAVKDAAWMNYPTSLVTGSGNRLYVTNGAYFGGWADLVRLGRP